MSTSNQMATALLTEHFRYTPLVSHHPFSSEANANDTNQTLLDDIINTVNELAFRAVNAIEDGLNAASAEVLGFRPTSGSALSEQAQREAFQDAKQNEIDNGIVQLETLLNATVDKDFDKFEIYTLRNILSVGHDEEDLAGWIRLEHYKSLDLSIAADAPTPEQVQLQRRKLQETIKLHNMLKAEEARNQVVLAKLHSLVNATGKDQGSEASIFAFLSSLQQSAKSATQHPHDQNVQYALTQLPALRDLLSKLNDSVQTIPQRRQATADNNSVDAKRALYIDSQSRRAVEKKGIDLVDPTSTGATAGRKIGRDEVEGVEAVMQALGGAAPLRRDDDDMEE